MSFSLGMAQDKKPRKGPKNDTIRVKGPVFVIIGDSSIFVENDTVFVLPDSLVKKMRFDNHEKSNQFYKRIKEKLYKTKFTRELYNLLFVDPETGNNKKNTPGTYEGNYEPYAGLTIRSVKVRKLEVFGTSINDTTKNVDNWAINLANKLHFYTRSKEVRNNIFFSEGDILEPDLLRDSERILRGLPYIKDARVFVVGQSGEQVDVLIVVKDVWSLSGEIDFSGLDRFDIAVIENNFLGRGHQVRNEFLYDNENRPKIGYQFAYTINNLYKGSFITGQFLFARSEPLDQLGISFHRNFITPETKYAGGLTLLNQRRELIRVLRDTVVTTDIEYNQQNVWFGRSFLIAEKEDGARINLQFAGKYQRTNFLARPTVERDTNQQFFDNRRVLFSVGFTSRNYEKSSLVAGFGRTEDIPKGYLIEITSGKEVNEFHDRFYLGGRFGYGDYIRKLGYLRSAIAYGGFVRNQKIEQGVLQLNIRYFSYLYRLNSLNFRQFFTLNYIRGIRQYDHEFVNINDKNGVRGLSYVFLRGTKKLVFSSESVLFTKLYLLGFRFAPFVFVDLAWVNNEQSKLLKNTMYQGYGLGFRLRNDNLAFNTIQVRLGWYPVIPPGNAAFDFDLTGSSSLGLQDFRVAEPEVLSFE
ncbi:MAG: hypothetical protein R3345_03435 [Fulvivirga sp.]|nr:hypothetical protein [Fulvivirga sp.]